MSTNADKDSVNELSLFAQKRLLKDIRNIHCDKTLKDNGIYYIHSTSEMARGYALIIGPEDTHYTWSEDIPEIYQTNTIIKIHTGCVEKTMNSATLLC